MKESNGRGFVIWITGLPGSGKTTIANELAPMLEGEDLAVEVFDGDWVREKLSPDLGFSKEDRSLHNKRVIHMSKLLVKHGAAVIVCLISPYREIRRYAREELGNFVEVFAKATIDTCIQRDPKGLYEKALKGEIKDMTGIQDPYQEPENPEIVVDTEKQTPEDSARAIMGKLKDLSYI